MTDICKCGHGKQSHTITIGCVEEHCPCTKYDKNEQAERMADVVSAAVRWRKWENKGNSASAGCDCESCTLIRAVDRYLDTNKEK